MAGFAGWWVAGGLLLTAALVRSQRPGEMNEERDRIYRECLSGRVPVEKMRELARAFEKARCFPQARMLRLRVELEELPEEIKEVRRLTFLKALASQNVESVLRVARAFEDCGATSSAAKLRRHAEKIPRPLEPAPVVTPEPSAPPPETVVLEAAPETLTNGVAPYVAVSEIAALAN